MTMAVILPGESNDHGISQPYISPQRIIWIETDSDSRIF